MKMKSFLILVCMALSARTNAQTNISWVMGMNIAANTYGNMHPRMALDGAGNPMVIWGRMSDQAVFFSKWTGASFSTPVQLNPSWLTVATASWMGPDIESRGDTVYVVVKRTPEAADTNYTYIFTSFNGGVTFSAPVRIDFIADSISRFPTVAVDSTGNPIVGFMKFNSTFGDSRWVVTRSSDYGNTFTADVKASDWSGPGDEVCDCCPGAIVSSGNTTAMIYRDNLNNIRDIWTGKSTDNAATFSSGFAVDTSNWMIMSCPASGPDGVIVGDTLYSVFMSGGNGPYTTYLSKSSLSSGMFSSMMKLSGSTPGIGQQNYPRIASDGNAMAVVWRQSAGGSIQLPILFTNSVANGFPPAYDTVDVNDITNTDVAVSNGNVYVVWQDDNSGTVKFRSGTYSPSTAGISSLTIDQKQGFSLYPNPAATTFTIQADPGLRKSQMTVTNLLGEKMLQIFLPGTGQKTEVDITAWPSGVYLVQLKSEHACQNQKIIKR